MKPKTEIETSTETATTEELISLDPVTADALTTTFACGAVFYGLLI